MTFPTPARVFALYMSSVEVPLLRIVEKDSLSSYREQYKLVDDITCNRHRKSKSASVNLLHRVHARGVHGRGHQNDCHASRSREFSHALNELWLEPKYSNKGSLRTRSCWDSTFPRQESPGNIRICN